MKRTTYYWINYRDENDGLCSVKRPTADSTRKFIRKIPKLLIAWRICKISRKETLECFDSQDKSKIGKVLNVKYYSKRKLNID
jgi:hypothetical protein